MNKQSIRISAALFALIITSAVGVGYTYAHSQDRYDVAKQEAVRSAVASGDYKAFVAAVGEEAQILETITEENFTSFIEAKQKLEAGDLQGAEVLFNDLGLEHHAGMRGRGKFLAHKEETHQAIRAAVEAEDYNAFVVAVGEEAPLLEIITEANFPTFVEIHELRMAGDFEAAHELADELGLRHSEHRRLHFKN